MVYFYFMISISTSFDKRAPGTLYLQATSFKKCLHLKPQTHRCMTLKSHLKFTKWTVFGLFTNLGTHYDYLQKNYKVSSTNKKVEFFMVLYQSKDVKLCHYKPLRGLPIICTMTLWLTFFIKPKMFRAFDPIIDTFHTWILKNRLWTWISLNPDISTIYRYAGGLTY